MISVENLWVRFGAFELLKDISFLIAPRDKIGLTGKNGAGKSTLLKIIAGEGSYDEGRLSKPSGIKLGYLPQHIVYNDTTTLLEEVKQAFGQVVSIKNELEEIHHKLQNAQEAHSDTVIALSERLHELNERFAYLDGYDIDSEIEKTLNGLGFQSSDFQRFTGEFSGGWRMRIELAKILLQKPDVFLLDEPTNHLDIESIQWLEDFLRDYPGAVILVSHDRLFLDNVTNRTIEISLGKVYDYKAPYSAYLELRQERREQELAAYRNQQKMIEETEKFIERFRYKATKAVQVQSRIKQLEKIDRLEIEEVDLSTLNIKFPPAPRAGTIVVEGTSLTKNYDALQVLESIDFVIERGEKTAFVGKNGQGKTTLVKMIMGQTAYEGEIKLGHQVNIGYFAQNQPEMLDPNLTVLQTIDHIATGEIRKKLRDILGAFLFSGEDVDKKVSVLSGGERSRLALACMLLEPYSLLILDEPTNHLDMRSKEVLKQALLNYDGTLILVSHDRHFLEGLVDKIYEFGNKKLRLHLGGINDFLYRKKQASMREWEQRLAEKKTTAAEKATSTGGKEQWLQKKEYDKRLRKAKNELNDCEKNINRIESELSEISTQMSDPTYAADSGLFKRYAALEKQLDTAMQQWELLSQTLEQVEAEAPAS